MRCLNYDPDVMMDSVKQYLGARNVRLVNEKKPGGSNPGLIFDLNDFGIMKRFFLKSNEISWGLNPDARELIGYLLLQHIGIGPPECYFIPNVARSKSVVYIATLEVGIVIWVWL